MQTASFGSAIDSHFREVGCTVTSVALSSIGSSPLLKVTHRAHFYLGTLYDNGMSVRKNLSRAMQHYLAAARGGHLEAKIADTFRIGYRDGQGVARNPTAAVHRSAHRPKRVMLPPNVTSATAFTKAFAPRATTKRRHAGIGVRLAKAIRRLNSILHFATLMAMECLATERMQSSGYVVRQRLAILLLVSCSVSSKSNRQSRSRSHETVYAECVTLLFGRLCNAFSVMQIHWLRYPG